MCRDTNNVTKNKYSYGLKYLKINLKVLILSNQTRATPNSPGVERTVGFGDPYFKVPVYVINHYAFMAHTHTHTHTQIRWCQMMGQNVTRWCHNLGQNVTRWCHNLGQNVTRWCHNLAQNVTRWCHNLAQNVTRWCHNLAQNVTRSVVLKLSKLVNWLQSYDNMKLLVGAIKHANLHN